MLRDIISMLLPDICAGCNRNLVNGERFLCMHCRYGLGRASSRAIDECRHKFSFPVEYCYAHWEFRQAGRVQKIIHAVKYGASGRLANQLGRDTARYISPSLNGTLVPVPQHPLRTFRRGFNQAGEFAKGIADSRGLRYEGHLLTRKGASGSQTHRNRVGRMRALEQSISVHARIPEDHYILVDDVVTTGATLQHCALSLLERSPSSKISIIVLATV